MQADIIVSWIDFIAFLGSGILFGAALVEEPRNGIRSDRIILFQFSLGFLLGSLFLAWLLSSLNAWNLFVPPTTLTSWVNIAIFIAFILALLKGAFERPREGINRPVERIALFVASAVFLIFGLLVLWVLASNNLWNLF